MAALIVDCAEPIARATAIALAAEGVEVSVAASTQSAADEVTAALHHRGGTVHGTALDQHDDTAIERWVRDAARRLRRIDIVVATVRTDEDARKLGGVSVNLTQATRLFDESASWLQRSGRGALVAVAVPPATAGRVHAHPELIYSTRIRALGWAAWNIRANCIQQQTAQSALRFTPAAATQAGHLLSVTALRNCPRARMASPQEVARTVAFLASPAASFINGSNLMIDGGFA